jgi:exopolyphosphatase/guanosine-5'-triphosphate,3'-diphosphate pyrophosphatase
MNSPLLAAIDVGTNSIHLVIARLGAGGRFETVTREKAVVRLGHGGGDMKRLEPDAIERGVVALERMGRLAAASGAPVRAVATSAVREAENADEFLKAAARVGVDVEVISGHEEARLIHLGALQAVPVYDRRVLVIDVGGGSTEVVVGERGRTLAVRSFKLGAVRLTDRFFPGGVVDTAAVASCRSSIRSVLAAFEREVARLGFEVAVASSGTAEALARVSHALNGADPLRTYNCFEFSRADLDAVVAALLAAETPAERRLVPGLDADRADIIVAGALVLEGVAEAFGIERFTFSDYALREGVLLDTLEREQGRATHHLRDVARRSVRHLAERCDDDLPHSAHVAALALQIFDATAAMHALPDEARNHLEAAALLANVGLVISHTKHHLHSYYVIRNSDDLAGFTDREVEIIALVARYHRKSAPKPTHQGYSRLDEESRRTVRVLAGILRVAIGLDRSHDQRVKRVTASVGERRLLLDVTPRRRSDDLSLEFFSAGERSGLLSESLGAQVELRLSL